MISANFGNKIINDNKMRKSLKFKEWYSTTDKEKHGKKMIWIKTKINLWKMMKFPITNRRKIDNHNKFKKSLQMHNHIPYTYWLTDIFIKHII